MWRTELDDLCDKCKYDFDTWCEGRKCETCPMSNKEGTWCICLTVSPHAEKCPYFIPKE